MSTPADRHPIDPISQALGKLEGRFDEFEKRVMDGFDFVEQRFDEHEKRLAVRFDGVGDRFASVDQRFRALERLIAGLYALVLLGFTALGWIVTRR